MTAAAKFGRDQIRHNCGCRATTSERCHLAADCSASDRAPAVSNWNVGASH